MKKGKKKKLLVGGVGLETSVTCVNFLLLVGGSYDIFHQSCSSLIIDKSARER